MPVLVTPVEGPKVERFYAGSVSPVPMARFGKIGCFCSQKFQKSAQEIKDFEVREDDVWVVTPPKCGTTWTQEMVWLLLHDLDYDGAREKPLADRSPFLEFSRFAGAEVFEDVDTVEQSACLEPPRFIKSHLPKELLPDQLWTKKPKIIYVCREPKDVAVSFYYHHKLMMGFQHGREFFFEGFFEDIVFFCPYWEHVLDFWKMKDEPHILFNTYEEMKQDLPAVIRRTAKFLGKSYTDEQVARLADHLSIEKMRNNPSVNLEDWLVKVNPERQKPRNKDDAFIRKGAVGEGRREMPPDMAAKFDDRSRRVFGEALKELRWKI